MWLRDWWGFNLASSEKIANVSTHTVECQREEANEQDPNAVAMVKRTAGHRTKVVAHVPREISAACTV